MTGRPGGPIDGHLPEDEDTAIGGQILPVDRPRPGQVLFGRYRLEKELGEGGMGSVWLVHRLDVDAPRALKMIVSEIASDAQVRARFRREARVMSRLVHPNAVTIHDAQLGQDAAFIEMEYVRGDRLTSLLREGPLPLARVTGLLTQLCDVLGAAHGLGIVHRDLKPSNLMLADGAKSGEDLLKVLDFGIAKVLAVEDAETDGVRTQANLFLGTPHYSSPEQIRGDAVDARSDVYSAGVILYEMLAGRRPFRGSPPTVIRDQLNAPPPPFDTLDPRPQVPPAVERVVARCLAKDPAGRPQTARDLIAEFHEALESPASFPVPVVSVPSPPPMPDRPATPEYFVPSRTRRPPASRAAIRFFVASGAALVVIVVAATWMAERRPANGPEADGRESKPSVPRRARPYDPGIETRRQVVDWKRDGYAPVVADGTEAGWPRTLVGTREDDGPERTFLLDRSGYYLPRGYRAEGEACGDDGWPRAINREADGGRFLRIEGGRFRMGRPDGERADRPAHDVILSGFYLQETEATNAEVARYVRRLRSGEGLRAWRTRNADLMATAKPVGEAWTHPATSLSRDEAEAYAESVGGMLPTEAQWEFAARSRGRDDLAFVWSWNPELAGRDPLMGGLAWVNRMAQRRFVTSPVAAYRATDATAQGVLDLAGNAREWCRDVFAPYEAIEPPPRDPCNRNRLGNGDLFVVRGGAYSTIDPRAMRATWRDRAPGTADQSDIGFRIAIETPESPGPRFRSSP